MLPTLLSPTGILLRVTTSGTKVIRMNHIKIDRQRKQREQHKEYGNSKREKKSMKTRKEPRMQLETDRKAYGWRSFDLTGEFYSDFSLGF